MTIKYLFLLLLIPFIEVEAKEYSLPELLKLANERDLGQQIEKTKVLEINSEIENSKSEYYPKLKAVIGGERRESNSDPSINDDNFVAELRVDYNLYSFGKTKNKINALKGLKKEQERFANYASKISEIKLKKEYYEGLYYKEVLQTLKKEIDFNKTLKKQVGNKRKQGLVGKADVLEIDMRGATLKNQVIQYQEHLKHTMDNIRKITLIAHEEDLTLKGKVQHVHVKVMLKDLVEGAEKFNRNLKINESKTKSLEYELNSIRSKRLPEINLRGRYGKMRVDEQYTPDGSTEGLVGVYIDIPLFDGGTRGSEVRLHKSKLAQSKLRLKKTQLDLKIDVTHKYEKMMSIHEQVDLGEQNVKNAGVYFKNVLKEYKNGVKNSIDLVSARDRLVNFKNNLVLAKKDFLIAKLELEEITGISFN